MNAEQLNQTLSALPLGPIRFFPCVGSTNEEARRWAEASAPHLSLVVTDEQTEGRGRMGRKWYTPVGEALAFSLILHPANLGVQTAPISENDLSIPTKLLHLTALGAIAVSEALEETYGLLPEIKWPNDVLVHKRKLAGILVEAIWEGDQLMVVLMGIGVNVTPKSLPTISQLDFPATCVETALGKKVKRVDLMYSILKHLLEWQKRTDYRYLIHAWENRLALRGEMVNVISPDGNTISGKISGLSPEGFLRLDTGNGEIRCIKSGDVRLRPANQVESNLAK
jgi:BirA family transcriptional regulator, biotin operon repressor / biotin---[acetyl-CoA-carboxylase] ligase